MYDAYIICGTPRTGSTLLCGLLADTGAAGRPDSFFRRQSIAWWADYLNIPGPDALPEPDFSRRYLDAIRQEGTSGCGLFGLRLMQENLGDLSARLDMLYPGLPDDAARIEAAFGKVLYLHLSRADKLAQAVSYAKAMQSGLWHVAPDGTEIERLAPHKAASYDADLLRQQIAEMEEHDQAWNQWFERHHIAPFRVTYEALSADPRATLAAILIRLGRDPVLADAVQPGVAKLADQESLDWMQRYRAEMGCPAPE